MHHPSFGKEKISSLYSHQFMVVVLHFHNGVARLPSPTAGVCERAFGIFFPFCIVNSSTNWINYSAVTYQEELSKRKTLKERKDRNYSWNSYEKGYSCSIFFFSFLNPPLFKLHNRKTEASTREHPLCTFFPSRGLSRC